MAARGRVADGVLGYAAVASEGMGRIAYVIFDRVRSIATASATHDGDILAFVMAHEIAHLLLPHGPQPSTGLMKSCWTVHDFRGLDVLKLGFSPQQASQIRRTIENEAARAGSNGDDARLVRQADEDAGALDRRENVPEERRAPPGRGAVSGCSAHGSR
jgi:hypothetical protein